MLIALVVAGCLLVIVALFSVGRVVSARFPTEWERLGTWSRQDPDRPRGQPVPPSLQRMMRQLERAPYSHADWVAVVNRLDEIGTRLGEPTERPVLPVGNPKHRWWHFRPRPAAVDEKGVPTSSNEVWLNHRLANLEALARTQGAQ